MADLGKIGKAAGQALETFGQIQNLRSLEFLSNLNAITLKGNARLVDNQIRISAKETAFTREQAIKAGKKVKSRQLAGFGKANVTGRTVDFVQDEAARDIALEALAIDYAGEVEKTRLTGLKSKFLTAASISKLQESSARKAADIKTVQFFTDLGTSVISGFK